MAVNTASIKPEDVVEVNRLGRRFFALVVSPPRRERGTGIVIDVDPSEVNCSKVTYRCVRGRDIVAHYRKLGRARG